MKTNSGFENKKDKTNYDYYLLRGLNELDSGFESGHKECKFIKARRTVRIRYAVCSGTELKSIYEVAYGLEATNIGAYQNKGN